jgi:hypothetical protein
MATGRRVSLKTPSGQPNPMAFSDAVGSGAVGVIERRARSKGRRVSFCRRRRLTRRPKNVVGSGKAVGSGHFWFFQKKIKSLKKNQTFLFFCTFSFSLIFTFFQFFVISLMTLEQ